ncbi:MAG: hypothetical protein HQL46_15110 [Gammaproteobacteria bacterium]|nr:hypothetical protein [Gammaproteobacteria bacterium]
MQNVSYKPKILEKWVSTQINKENLNNQKNISIRLQIFYAFLVGFVFSLPLIYIDTHYPDTEFFTPLWFEKIIYIGVTVIIGSIIEMVMVLKISVTIATAMANKYGYDFEQLRENYILGFDFLLSRLVVGVEEPKVPIDTIDAYKNVGKFKPRLIKLLYYLRITISNAISKFIVRRVFIQNGLRMSIEWASAIVIGFWNAVAVYFNYKKIISILEAMTCVDKYIDNNFKQKDLNFLILYQIIGNVMVSSGRNIPIIQYIYVELKKLDRNKEIHLKEEFDDVNLLLKNIKNTEPNEIIIYQDFFNFLIQISKLKNKAIITLKSSLFD